MENRVYKSDYIDSFVETAQHKNKVATMVFNLLKKDIKQLTHDKRKIIEEQVRLVIKKYNIQNENEVEKVMPFLYAIGVEYGLLIGQSIASSHRCKNLIFLLGEMTDSLLYLNTTKQQWKELLGLSKAGSISYENAIAKLSQIQYAHHEVSAAIES